MIEEYFNENMTSGNVTGRGSKSTVYRYESRDENGNPLPCAYKEYKSAEDAKTMEEHLKIFDTLEAKLPDKSFFEFGAFPLRLIYKVGDRNGDTFLGFAMPWLRDGFYDDGGERNLDFLLTEKLKNDQLKTIGSLLPIFIYTIHLMGYCLGDAISTNNLLFENTHRLFGQNFKNSFLKPYFIDVDAFFKVGKTHPIDKGTLFFRCVDEDCKKEEAEGNPVDPQKTDVGNFSLVMVRLFSDAEICKLAPLGENPADNESKADLEKSLERIKDVFGLPYRNLIEKGLSLTPSERPSMEKFVELIQDDSASVLGSSPQKTACRWFQNNIAYLKDYIIRDADYETVEYSEFDPKSGWFIEREGKFRGKICNKQPYEGKLIPFGNTTVKSFEGSWRNGRFCGQGTVELKNGDIFNGNWENGRLEKITDYSVLNGRGKDSYKIESVPETKLTPFDPGYRDELISRMLSERLSTKTVSGLSVRVSTFAEHGLLGYMTSESKSNIVQAIQSRLNDEGLSKSDKRELMRCADLIEGKPKSRFLDILKNR